MSAVNPLVSMLSGVSDKIVVQSGRKIYFIEIEKISYIEACNYYALIHADNKTYIARQTLDDFEKRLSPHAFLRIHRSIILNLNIFQCMERENNTLMVRTTIGRDFKVSRYRQKVIKERILV
jgi:two-component system LytT family response regulator